MTLDGTLEIAPSTAGLGLVQGDEFDFVFFGARVGNFTTYVLPPLSGGLQWQAIHSADRLTLKVVQS
jgi:hypothetical protein